MAAKKKQEATKILGLAAVAIGAYIIIKNSQENKAVSGVYEDEIGSLSSVLKTAGKTGFRLARGAGKAGFKLAKAGGKALYPVLKKAGKQGLQLAVEAGKEATRLRNRIPEYLHEMNAQTESGNNYPRYKSNRATNEGFVKRKEVFYY